MSAAASAQGRVRLGELLVREGKISEADLKEALEAQVIHGGRLGTNLLELGLIDEPTLAAALGKQLGVQHASGKMEPDPRALELISAEEADDRDVLPMRVDATRVSVAVLNPGELATLDALAFKTGRRVIPVVVPEFRMHQLLRAYCGAFRPLRALDLEGPRRREAAAGGGPVEQGGELTSEEEFQALYASALAGGLGAGAAARSAMPAPPAMAPGGPVAGLSPVPGGASAAAPPPAAAVTPAPAMAPAATAAKPPPIAAVLGTAVLPAGGGLPMPGAMPTAVAASAGASTPTGTPPPAGSPEPGSSVSTRSSAGPAHVAVRAPPPAPVTPLWFQEAQARLAASADREQVAQTVLRFAIGKWKRALLLSVQRDYVLGWHGLGADVREAAVRRIAVPLRPGNTFRLVRDTRAHFVGPLKRDAATQVFARLLGGGFPTTAVMLPLLVRGRVVHILYVDNGPDQLTTPDVGELMILSHSVARSYELMIQQRASH